MYIEGMAKFIVTGGAGFIGSHLVDLLLRQDHEVIVLDNLVTGCEKNLNHLAKHPRLAWISHDITHSWDDYGRVDGVFNLASPASPDDFVPLSLEILKVGSSGTWNALEYATKYKAWFLQASTSEVYGDPLVHPQVEEYFGNVNCRGVRSVYDESKRFSESLVSTYQRQKGLKASVVRIFNTYGPRMRSNDGRVIPNLITQALQGKDLTIYGDGKQTRSFCYVDDLVEGIYAFWKYQPTDPINLGNPVEMNMLQTAQAILEKTNSTSKVVFHPLPENDPKQRCPDISKAKKTLYWEPKVLLEQGLERTVAYFQSLKK